MQKFLLPFVKTSSPHEKENKMERQVPTYKIYEFNPQKSDTKYCVGIPLLNEGEKIRKQLKEMQKAGIHKLADIIIFDGGSKDGSTDLNFLKSAGVGANIPR
jgi:dolichol-phosphate mannosyltransferase